MREFKYDVVQLIHGVRDRPCLWDKSLDVYKDRAERRQAWEEVFGILEPRYEEMSSEQKRVIGEQILNKWTNVRDTFVKTLKTKMGRPRRKYLLYEHLKFLIKVTNTEEDFNVELSTDDSTAYNLKTERESPKEIPTTSVRKRSKKTEYSDEEPNTSKEFEKYNKSDVDFAEIEEFNDPRIMNEDEAFFASLLPSVVKYSEDERLEFRIEVLAVMKRIKEKRNW